MSFVVIYHVISLIIDREAHIVRFLHGRNNTITPKTKLFVLQKKPQKKNTTLSKHKQIERL
jgi:hypothetical protein